MTRSEAVRFLTEQPYKFGHLLGFTKLTPLHNKWIIEMVKEKGDHTLQAHRNSYKTTCVSIAIALIIILLPKKRTLFLRKTDADVKEIVSQVQKILESQVTQYFVTTIYGVNLKLTQANALLLSTNLITDAKGTAQLTAQGTGGSLTGKHFDFIFTDDIVNVKDRISRAERDRTKLIYQELRNIVNRGGRIFNTGTPWHVDDAFKLMPNAEVWDCYRTGIMSPEDIEKARDGMTASLFAANYELKHIASDDVMFTSPHTGADPAMAEQGETHIDAAYGGEDFTAMTIIHKVGEDYYVFGKCWQKHIDDVIDEALTLHNSFNSGAINCETNGDKGYLAKDIKRRGYRVKPYHENMNKFAKITAYLKPAWSHIYFVQGTDDEYINQICDFNEHVEHDDCPDSLACMIRRYWGKQDNSNYQSIFG